MNLDKLDAALNSYKDAFAGRWNDERFKWDAVKHFQDHWDIKAENLSAMIEEATGKTESLLISVNNFPRGMIVRYAEKDPEAVRAMFINLFDDKKDLGERITKFQDESQRLCDIYSPGKSHYQRPMAITVYLWLNNPEKYTIYKYSNFKSGAIYLESDYIPAKGHTTENIPEQMKYLDALRDKLASDKEFIKEYRSYLDENSYDDPNNRLLAVDFSHYIANVLVEKKEKSTEWLDPEFNPGISVDEWVELIVDENVFNSQSLEIIKRLDDYGGEATCTQLATRYGESANFYNVGSSSLGKRIQKKTGCKTLKNKNGKDEYWSILYNGRYANSDEEGVFVWKIRDELREALKNVDISVDLYAGEEQEDKQYWWLNANPKVWRFSDIAVGEMQTYTLYNDNGNKRRIFQNFLDAKAGDLVIGYESNPVKQVVALAKIAQDNDGQNLYFEKVEGLSVPIDYAALRNIPELEKMEYFQSAQGSLFKLTKGEYEIIMDLIREENPAPGKIEDESKPKYDKESFLNDVFMSESRYESLKTLLLHKKNVILQGAPGVGKTFAARRLAYSILGEEDDSKIEFVQFHQSYTYEDFIMGYKPYEDGFRLENGIFYRFCKKAENEPQNKFFFIIDEINRGNMSKIFGELLMLIEKDYRGTKATLAYDGLSFAVPENLYIIGMMNTADRSLALIDYALRRRFSFFSMAPGFSTDGFKKYQKSLENETLDELILQVEELNRQIKDDPTLGEGFCIGHSYFCGQKTCTSEWMRSVVDYEILPMLEEYWFDDKNKVQKWQNILEEIVSSNDQ